MSIKLTIYDVFTILIPGLIYLYIINEASVMFLPGQKIIEYDQLQGVWFLVAGAAAYVIGQLVGSITYRWTRLIVHRQFDQVVLNQLKKHRPKLKIGFSPDDYQLLYGVIQHHNLEIAQTIETSRVSMAMMMNISFGLALFALLQIMLIIHQRELHPHLLLFICAVIATYLAFRRAKDFERWFYRDIYREALNYGSNLEEVLEVSRNITARTIDRSKEKEDIKREAQFE